MTSLVSLFNYAEASLAAYADLNDGKKTLDQKEALKEAGMTEDQAIQFASRWPDVIEQYTDAISGFSATLFRNGNEVCLAIAGTDSLLDVAIDIGLAEGLGAQAQYNALQGFYGSLISTGKIQSTDSVTVSGHSLGGFLAQIFAVDHAGEIAQTYTYNAPGIGGSVAQILDLMGVAATNIDTSNILNVQGDGFSVTAGLGTLLGSVQQVQIENNAIWIPGDHTIKKLTDSLAVYDTLWQLDPSFTLEQYAEIFKASSNDESLSLEGAVSKLCAMFGVAADSALTSSNENMQREALFSTVYRLRDTESYNALINNATVSSSLSINAQQAATDFGAFLALHTLSPIYISGAALQEVNGSLYDQWSAGHFSAQYLEDRVAMLGALLGANMADIDYDDVRGVYFSDAETGVVVGESDGGIFSADNKQTLFGSEASDTLTSGNANDHLYGGGGSDFLASGAGDDYLEGGAGDDGLNAGTGFDRVNGGMGNDAYLIDSNFGDVMIADDLDGGSISLLSGITFRRVGDGEANANGLYIAVDENGEWLNGKDGWSVSVSGSTATVSIMDNQNNVHVIAIEDFNITSNKFGIQFDEMADVEMPSLGGAFTVPNRGLLGAYTPQGAEKPVEVFLPNNRHVENKDPSIPEALNVEQYRNKSLIYNAVDYWGEWNASDLRWESIEDYPGTPHPDHPDEVLVIYTRESSHGIKVMRFEGSNQNDALYGNDWTSQMRAIEAWDQTNYHHYRLNEINDFDPEIHGNNDVLFGLNGDDLIIGDGDQSVLTQPVGSQKGNRDILVGGRGSDVIYGMGGNDILLGMEQYRSSWGAASLGLTYNPSKYASLAEAIFNNAFLYDPETQQETQTAITLEDKDERNYLNGGDGDDVLEGASFSDVLDGGHGKDWIYAGAGRDVVAGGAGDDEISGDSYAYFYQGIAYSDFIAPDELPEANDYRRGHFYQKTSEGVALRYDFNKNTDYNDVLDGGEGNDLVQGEIGADIVSGGAGNDVLFGDRVFGAGFFVDGLPPANFQSLAQQFHGNDVVDGGDGDDLVVGGGGADRVLGGNGNDTIYGDVGLDTIEKGMNTTGAPSIASSDEGWWGNDVLLGGAGNDVLVGEGGDDVVDGGEGDDYLYGDWANWQAQAYADPEARTGNDTLYGGAGNDQLMGNGGDDVLDGGAGDDFLYAGIGDDTLIGGSGNDYLDGGEGDDVYSIAAGDGQDVITDTEGSNILRVATGSVEVETAGNDAATVYLSADRSQFVTLTQGSLNTFSVQTANGDAVTQRQHIEVSTRYGSPLVYTVNSSMTGDVDVNGAEAGVALQLTSARQAFTAPAAVTVDESGAHILLTRADGKALTVHLDSWDQLTALTDKYGFHLDFSLDASAESNGVLNGRSGNDALTGNEGDETLYGYNGNDTLTGAGGNDNLIGGAGDDRYVFTSGDNGADTVLDHEGSNTLQLNHLSGNSASVDVLVGTQSVQVLTSKDGSSYATMDNATWQAIASCETADGVAVSEYRYRIAAGASVTLTPHFDGAQFVILLPAGSTLADFSGGHSLSHPQDLVLQAADGTFIRVEGYFASNGFSNNSAWSIGSDAESSQSLASWVDTHMSSDYSIDGFLTEQTAVLQPMGEAGKTLGDTQNIVVGEQYTVEGEAYGARIKSYTFDGVSAESIVLDGSPLVVASSEQNTMDLSEQTHWVLTEVPVYRDYYTNGGTYTLSGDDPALGSMRVNGNVSLQENDDGTVTATVSGNYSSSQVGTEARWTSYTETVADVTRRYTQYQITGDERDDTVTASGSFLGTIDVGDGDNTVDLGGDHQTLWSFWKPRGGLDVPGAYLTAGSGDDHLIGTRGNDVLRANAGANTVVGGAGNDV
ncbi:MAG: hypothetical protein R3E67_05660 [Pseudomonadales bacterium]